MSRLIKQIEKKVVDPITGEETTVESHTEKAIPPEPDYVKLYVSDLVGLANLPKSHSAVLFELLRLMDYTNRVIVISARSNEICNRLGIKPNTFKKALMGLVSVGILTNESRSVYLFNPRLFGRGPWTRIRKLRLEVNYSKAGREVIGTVERDEEPGPPEYLA